MIRLCQYWYRFALMLLLFRIRVYIKPQTMLHLELVKYNKRSDSVIQGKQFFCNETQIMFVLMISNNSLQQSWRDNKCPPLL